jgi:hypothetical protein
VTAVEREQPAVVEGPVVDLDALIGQPLQHPPATRSQVSCLCGKGSIAAHGPFSCDEVLQIRARVQADEAAPVWRQYVVPVAGGLIALAAGGLLVWAVVAGVAALVGAVTIAAAWVSEYWPLALLGLLLLGGGTACVGLHCGGCRG